VTILAGDIGGTKTVVAAFEAAQVAPRPLAEASYRSADHPSFEDILRGFCAQHSLASPRAACFAVAGAVVEGRAHPTNLPWPALEESALAEVLGVPRVTLLNDLEATAYGVLTLPPSELVTLNPGEARPRRGNAAVIAAGTGLGEACLAWDGSRHRAVGGEAGHADFAPRSDEEVELLRFLRSELGGRVSVERVVSGPGLHGIYRFLRSRSPAAEPVWLTRQLADGDPSAVVSELALARREAVCVRALELFVSLYGAEAGNLALRSLAVAGVFVAGGIAPRILPALREGSFVRAFRAKGRFEALLAQIPVRVATNPRAALLGAAHRALEA
jgi:glucokinase